MVLEITIERDYFIDDTKTDAYTVHVDSHRILTVATSSNAILAKWLAQALKFTKTTTVLVGVAAEAEAKCWGEKGKESPYDIICLNIGSHSLIYELPWDPVKPKHPLVSFFQNPRVFAVGRDMATLSRKLKALNGVKILNVVDVNDLAVKGLRRDDLNFCRCDLDKLARAVLGKHMDVDRPESELDWNPYEEDEYYLSRSCEKVKFFWAVDPYLCFLIGIELIDAIDNGAAAAGLKKKNKKKKSK